MITRARHGVWETNSSTMNQLAVHRIVLGKYDIPEEVVVLNDDGVSHAEGETVWSTVAKIKLAWMMLMEMWGNATFLHDTIDLDFREAEKLFLRVLKDHGVRYDIDEYFHFNRWSEYHVTGDFSGGGADLMVRMFREPALLERFLFDPRSNFTWGVGNNEPGDRSIGYADARELRDKRGDGDPQRNDTGEFEISEV